MQPKCHRFFFTIPKAERRQVLAGMMRHISEQVTALGLFYAANPSMIANHLANVTARSQNATETWNAHEWAIR